MFANMTCAVEQGAREFLRTNRFRHESSPGSGEKVSTGSWKYAHQLLQRLEWLPYVEGVVHLSDVNEI